MDFGPLSKVCNSTYRFSSKKVKRFFGYFRAIKFFFKFQVLWEDNWKRCCSIGMEPIILEVESELECLSNAAKGEYHFYTDLRIGEDGNFKCYGWITFLE